MKNNENSVHKNERPERMMEKEDEQRKNKIKNGKLFGDNVEESPSKAKMDKENKRKKKNENRKSKKCTSGNGPGSQDTLQVVTYNIHYLNNKLIPVQELLEEENIDILMLQETKREEEKAFKINMSNYNFLEKFQVHGVTHGLAFAIRKEITFMEMEMENKYIQTVKLMNLNSQFICATIYIPPRGSHWGDRNEAIGELINFINEYKQNLNWIIAGDFNMNNNELEKLLETYADIAILDQHIHQEFTFKRGASQKSKIDFIIGNEIYKNKAKVLHNYEEISDHIPLSMGIKHIQIKKSCEVIRLQSVDRTKIKNLSNDFSFINNEDIWKIDDEEKEDEVIQNLLSKVQLIIKNEKLVKIKSLQRTSKRRIKIDSSLWMSLQHIKRKIIELKSKKGNHKNKSIKEKNAEKDLKLIKRKIWKQNRENERKRANNLHQMLLDPNDIQHAHQVIKNSILNQNLLYNGTLLKDDNGFITESKETICKLWEKNLSSRIILKEVPPYKVIQQENQQIFFKYEPITWEELNPIITNIAENKKNKAKDKNNWVNEMLLWATRTFKDEKGNFIRSKCGTYLLDKINKFMENPTETIDENFAQTLIHPIYKPKKKNPFDPRSYRTISVQPIIRNVVSNVLAKRMLNTTIQHPHIMDIEQAAFLHGSEAILSAATLYELAIRRSFQGKITIISASDVSNAYASVNVEILMKKLIEHGFDKKTRDVIVSIITPKVWNLSLGGEIISTPIKHKSGLPEGDPSSPILYNLYTNGILNNLPKTTEIPMNEAEETLKVKGLRFADDMILLNKSFKDTALNSVKLEAECERIGQSYDLNKSGNMLVILDQETILDIRNKYKDEQAQNEEYKSVVNRLIEQLKSNDPETWQIIKHFKILTVLPYLGIKFHWTLDLVRMASISYHARIQNAKKHLNMINNMSITMFTKMIIIKSYMLSKINYGSELFGLASINKIQNFINDALRKANKTYGNPNLTILYQDMNVLPISIIHNANMLRAITKWSKSSTHGYFPVLAKSTPNFKKRKTYIEKLQHAEAKMNKEIESAFTESDTTVPVLSDPKAKSKLYKSIALENYISSKLKMSGSNSLARYVKYKMKKTAKQLLMYNHTKNNANAIRQIRCQGFKSTRQMALNKEIDQSWLDSCPMCSQVVKGGESPKHMLLYCKRWEVERKKHILPTLKSLILKALNEHYQLPILKGKIIWNLLLPNTDEDEDVFAALIGGISEKFKYTKKRRNKDGTVETLVTDWISPVSSFINSINKKRRKIIKKILKKEKNSNEPSSSSEEDSSDDEGYEQSQNEIIKHFKEDFNDKPDLWQMSIVNNIIQATKKLEKIKQYDPDLCLFKVSDPQQTNVK